MRKLFSLIPAALVLLALACGPTVAPRDSAQQEADLTKSQEQKQAIQCDPGVEHWHGSTQPKRGGVLKAAMTARSMPHLDPTQPGISTGFIPQVYRRLVSARACYYEDTVIEPDMAKSWQVSDGGQTWTFKLRDDVRWHNKPPVNGRSFSSADVGWTVEMQKQGGQLRSYWEKVAHEEPDAKTVVLRLPEPDADFLGKLGEAGNMIFPHEVKEQFKDFKSVAIGLGPFMLKDFKGGQISVIQPNPDWKELGADGRPVPYVSEYQAIGFDDYFALVSAVRTGQVDISDEKGFNKPEADLITQANAKHVRFDDIAGNVWGLYFNLSKKPFDDVRVRKAMSLAMDREEIIQGAVQGGAVRTGFLPVGIKDYAWGPEKSTQKFSYNPEQAKSLLKEAGYDSGQLEVTLDFGQDYTQDSEIVGRQLNAVGIQVKLAPSTVGTAALLSGATFGLVYGAPTGSSYLPERWFGPPLRTGGSTNFYRLSDPQVDALSAAQNRELDTTKRKQIMDQLQDRLYDIMAFAPVMSRFYYHFQTCQVKNVRPQHPTFNKEGLAHAWIDPTGCQ